MTNTWNSKILITGGDGFIAKSLNEFLEIQMPSYDIHLCNRQTLDLLDSKKVEEYLKKHKFDVIIHTATYDAAPSFSTKDSHKVLNNNLAMFFNLTRCSDSFGKMLYFGTGAEFGRENWIDNMGEDYFDKYVPIDWPYGFSKYIMTKHSLLSDNIYNFRIFGLFGEYDDWRYRVIPNACCKAVFDLPITIKKNVLFDCIYIDDLSELVKWFIDNDVKHKTYNICRGESYQYKDLAEIVKKISRKDLEIIVEDEDLNIVCGGDNSRLLSEVKDFKFEPIEISIQKIYSWCLINKDKIDVNKMCY